MKVFSKIADLQNELFEARKNKKTVGLVPTMGALHAGHASWVKRSVSDNDVTVVSVFVNPTQFNDKTDLNTYPRTLDEDCKLLESVGADCVFAPSVEEVYPSPDTRSFEFPPVTTVMEGAHRPGHLQRSIPGRKPVVLHRTSRQGLFRRKGLAANCSNQGVGEISRSEVEYC